jgi:hypothetical protein
VLDGADDVDDMADAEQILQPTIQLVSPQSLDPHFYEQPILLQPHHAALWRRLVRWDQAYQQRVAAAAAAGAASAASSSDPPLSLGWTGRGVFLDGPHGVGRSSSLYALTCLARAHGWMAVHIADCGAWVEALQSGAATRMFVQAVYEAAAACARPSTATWSSPHSLLQVPLSPSSEYTVTLVDQGIASFGELLTLALELDDGSEESELAVECIEAQLRAMQDEVPVLLCLDNFQALTQKCLSQPGAADLDDEQHPADPDSLVAPLNASPFSWANFARGGGGSDLASTLAPAQPFRGGFVIGAESFALVQQSAPEMIERLQLNDNQGSDDYEAGGESSNVDATRPSDLTSSVLSPAVADSILWPLAPLADVSLPDCLLPWCIGSRHLSPRLASRHLALCTVIAVGSFLAALCCHGDCAGAGDWIGIVRMF